MLAQSQIIRTLKALADPNRLHLYELLLVSDRTNSELMEATGLRQNLLSHHLNMMCMSGLIRAVQSIGDARRHYYSADLHAARAFATWWQHHAPPDTPDFSAIKTPCRVLFLCRCNASRSAIAEVLARHYAPPTLEVYSAGLEDCGPPLPAVTLQVLADHQISLDGFFAKRYVDLPDVEFDYLITVCDIVHENSIPDSLRYRHYIHWSLRDPVDGIDVRADQLRMARELYDELVLRLSYFALRLADDAP